MGTAFCISGLALEVIAPAAGLSERREIGAEDAARFADWSASYKRLVGQETEQSGLLTLGRALYAWLDGGERWLERLLAAEEPPLVVEFRSPANPDPTEAAFLQVPWELLATEQGFLAADAVLNYCPLRRLGEPGVIPPLDSDLCLGLVFMAAAPQGADELDFEGEESAILAATGHLGLDLEVEESGNPELLGARLAAAETMQVLHLSCHGESRPRPALLLEDVEGRALRTEARALIEVLSSPRPRLLFLSACQTAQRGATADSLALTLLRGGVPAVLGWDGSVRDGEATVFASELYEGLSRRRALEVAVAGARRALLNGERPARDWHLARLWLRPTGGGALVGGTRRRRLLEHDHGHKQLLDARRQRLPVASRAAFVGRRRAVQEGLRVLRQGPEAGLLIHGMGRLGKSSLAARLAHRLPELELAVVYEHYDAVSIADVIAAACPAAKPLIATQREALLVDPALLEDVLRRVLEGPCQRGDGGGQPVLLLIDDLDRLLEDPLPGGRHRVKADFVPVLRSVLYAFARARTASRLVLTSRFVFTLPDGAADLGERLHALQLGPMHEAGRGKQALRQLQLAGVTSPATADAVLIDYCVALSQGSPGLQDLLVGLALEAPAAADAALSAMAPYLAQGDLPDEQTVQDFLKDLALGHLLGLLELDEKALLCGLTLFELPVPMVVAAALQAALGGSLPRLLGLGLCDRLDDLATPSEPAVAVNALARPALPPLAEAEAQTLTRLTLEPLFQAWGGTERLRRPYAADVELVRLGLNVADVTVLRSCAVDALLALDASAAYRQAAAWGQRAIALLQAAGMMPPLPLLWRAGEACMQVGEAEPAGNYYDQALARIAAGEAADPFEHGGLALAQGRLLAQSGEPDRALALFEQARRLAAEQDNPKDAAMILGDIAQLRADKGDVEQALQLHDERLRVFEALGERRERATTLGDIARLRADKGDVDQALELQGEVLRVYEALGERRSRAVTLGDIARLRADKGDVDQALELQCERLEETLQLGDLDGQAASLWDIAHLGLLRGDTAEAAPLIAEAYRIVDRIGRLDAICVIGELHGRILAADGQREEALQVLRRSEAGFRQTQRYADADKVAETISKIEQRDG